MEPVQSSNIAAMGYDGDTLTIRFHSGKTFSYAGVPGEIFASMRAAPSKGRFFAQHIKPFFTATEIEQ